LPFKDTLSPEVYTLVLCQLWGDFAGGLNGREEMRNDVVDLGCAAVSTARARLDGTISSGDPLGPENSAKEALPDRGDIHDSRGLDIREDMRNDMLIFAAISMPKARSGGTITGGAPSGPEVLTEEAVPNGGEVQEGGNEEQLQLQIQPSSARPSLMLQGKMTAPRGPDTPARLGPATKE
jgi:hypothetical protein